MSFVQSIKYRFTPVAGRNAMKSYRIATIPGDGIGKEVVPAGQRVLEVLANTDGSFSFEFENFGWGGDYYRSSRIRS